VINSGKRASVALVLTLGGIALALIYVFQRINYGTLLLQALGMGRPGDDLVFVINKTVRLLANDLICFFVIYLIFKERGYRQVAFGVFLVELLLILPLYLLLKLNFEGSSEISSPLLSFIHRLIVNPTLMVLTGIALAYQKFVISKNTIEGGFEKN
jgi:exosortase F-associated protein